MAVLNGYIKIHRKLVQWGWYQDSVVKDVFLHLLIVAAYKDGYFMGHKITPGQAIVGTEKMANELGFSRQQVRTALKKLESTGEISQKSTNKFTIITIENWSEYQIVEDITTNEQPTDNHQVTNEQPTDNQRITTSKEGKESKKVKKVKNNILIAPTLQEIAAYVAERKSPVDPTEFYEYFTAGNWHDSKGNPVKSWKQKLITWEKFTKKGDGNGDKEPAKPEGTIQTYGNYL